MKNAFANRMLTVLKVLFARLRFVGVFVIAALIVGYWDNIKNHVDKWTRPVAAPDSLATSAAASVEYFCPMHPEVVRQQAGQCPKCGMPLVKRKRGEEIRLPQDVLARVQLTPQRIALAHVGTSPVEYRQLVRETEAMGVLDYDETKLARISARVGGRADELFVTYTGQTVKQGDPLYSLYSPDLLTAQREYLLARARLSKLPPDATADLKNDASTVANAASQKLLLWGVTNEQLKKLEDQYLGTGQVPTHLTVTSPISGVVVKKEIAQGQYLQVGDAPYTVADLSVVWLQAKLYERDIPLVNIGDAAEISVEALPSESFHGSVSFKAFQIDPATRTLDARVTVENPQLTLRPGMFAAATFHVPVAAALPAATHPATAATSAPASTPADASKTFMAAMEQYLKAHTLLSEDKAEGVATLLEESVKKLEPLIADARVQAGYQRLEDAVAQTPGQPLNDLRATWKDVSAAMIEIGKAVGLPAQAPTINIFYCPMKKASWLQEGDKTANPYYGSEMFECGNVVEPLRKSLDQPSTTSPASASPQLADANSRGQVAANVLAVPRSAVIDTGKDKIVYVESSPGVYDMKAVKLGPIAGDYYPVVGGLVERERVVSSGAFLIDAENRLNPTRSTPAAEAANRGTHQHEGHAP